MKLNYQKIARMAGSMLGIDQNKLDSAIKQASQMTNGVTSKSDALNVLKRNGIDNGFLSKMQNIVNSNPVANKIAGIMGVNINDINRSLNDLQTGNNNQGSYSSDDKIAQMRKRLEKAKK